MLLNWLPMSRPINPPSSTIIVGTHDAACHFDLSDGPLLLNAASSSKHHAQRTRRFANSSEARNRTWKSGDVFQCD